MADSTVTKNVNLKISAQGAERVPGMFDRISQSLRQMNQAAKGAGLAGDASVFSLLKGGGIALGVKLAANAVQGMADAWKDVSLGVISANEGFFRMAGAIPILGDILDMSKAIGQAMYAASHAGELQAANWTKTVGASSAALRAGALGGSSSALGSMRNRANLNTAFGKDFGPGRNAYEQDQRAIDGIREQRAKLVEREFQILADRAVKQQIPRELDAVQRAELAMLKSAREAIDERIPEMKKMAAEELDRTQKSAREAMIFGLGSLREAFFQSFGEAGKEFSETINAASVASLREKIKRQFGLLMTNVPGIQRDISEFFSGYMRRQSAGSYDFEKAQRSAYAAPLTESRFLTGAGRSTGQRAVEETAKNTKETAQSVKTLATDIGTAIAQAIGKIFTPAPTK